MRLDRRAVAALLAALAVGIAVWTIGRLRPGIDGELARRGGTVVPVIFEREAAVSRQLAGLARALGPGVAVVEGEDGPMLAAPAGLDPGPGFLPPRPLADGRAGHRPTPDRAERWRKQAFNRLAERLDARLEALPAGRGQVALPSRDAMRLELTPDVDPAWIAAVFAPGELTLWRDGAALADGLDVIRAELREATLHIGLREAAQPDPGPVEARLDGAKLAVGVIVAGEPIALPLAGDVLGEARARAAMALEHGPLPLPARPGPSRPIEPGR